jgi:hypothetical protein
MTGLRGSGLFGDLKLNRQTGLFLVVNQGFTVKGTSINCLCPLALSPAQNQGVLLKPCLLHVEKAQRGVWVGLKAPQGVT